MNEILTHFLRELLWPAPYKMHSRGLWGVCPQRQASRRFWVTEVCISAYWSIQHWGPRLVKKREEKSSCLARTKNTEIDTVRAAIVVNIDTHCITDSYLLIKVYWAKEPNTQLFHLRSSKCSSSLWRQRSWRPTSSSCWPRESCSSTLSSILPTVRRIT